ncbi:pyridoxine 5'-phosphate synthase [Bartonella sp. DGB2]|uniref:pyridoxine 5'-phosphate synthase n=1 Tax=Bartonella sp. DGB2 TaxID=3388426 RepID=UPI00398FBE15
MAVKLSVNLNAVAVLRNRRNLPWPSVTHMGRIALSAGAAGLTVHPRPDQRHICFDDSLAIRQLIDAEFPEAEFNIEGYPSSAFLEHAALYADQITLVPDDPNQSTSDHGWNFKDDGDLLTPIIADLKARGLRVSLFVDPVPDGLAIAKALGADRVEIYTGPYGAAHTAEEQAACLEAIVATASYAQQLGLGLNAGHDLTVANLPLLVENIPWLSEVSIGHGLIADALEFGMHKTVSRFLAALAFPKV